MGEKPRAPPQPGREGETRAAGSSRKWRKPQECFQKGTLGTRDQEECPDKNPGGGEASEAVGAEQPLKKKNQTAKRSLSPTPAPRHGFLLVENVRSFHTSTNKRPYSNPVVQVRNITAVSGGRGFWEGKLGERGWESMSKSLPPSCQTPSPAPASSRSTLGRGSL